MRGIRFGCAVGIVSVALAGSAGAVDGPFLGADLAATIPTNGNYRAHAQPGLGGGLFGGHMFNDYFGLQGNVTFTGQGPDDYPEREGIPGYNHWTNHFGYVAGPRLQVPILDRLDVYALVQGGGFTGTRGRLRKTSAGLVAGGGADYYLTDHIALGIFGRYNRAFQSPRPIRLEGLAEEDQGPADAEWVSTGIALTYRFNGPEVTAPPPPPAPIAEPEPAPAPPVKKKIVLRGVNFDLDKATLRPDAVAILDEAAETLNAEAMVNVLVIGHTDSSGTDAYNQNLSERRAAAVKDYLVSKDVAASRLTTDGKGESDPVEPNDTAEGRAANRRVELKIQ